MKVLIAGGSGFIGRALVDRLVKRGDDVAVLTRDPARVRSGRPVEWNPPPAGKWSSEVASAGAVVNLAGENIADGRWTPERKRRLLQSRMDATNALVAAMKESSGDRAFISASAIGFYGPRGDEVVDERSAGGAGFLAGLTREWESAARAAESMARLVIARFGVVLDSHGGALAKMLPPFRLGVGGPIGTGTQWMSWVHREDVVRFLEWAIDGDDVRGVYNVTAEEPVRNRDFTRALGSALGRPAFMPVPGFALRMLFGEMADEVLLSGQRVVPMRAGADGFAFRYRQLDAALADIVKR